jgi:hypothetical protein
MNDKKFNTRQICEILSYSYFWNDTAIRNFCEKSSPICYIESDQTKFPKAQAEKCSL